MKSVSRFRKFTLVSRLIEQAFKNKSGFIQNANGSIGLAIHWPPDDNETARNVGLQQRRSVRLR